MLDRPQRLYPKACSSRLALAERKQFLRVTAVPYTPWWWCYVSKYNKLEYVTLLRRTWVTAAACWQQHCIRNCGQTTADTDLATTDSL